METYINETRPFTIVDEFKNKTKMTQLEDRLEGFAMPEGLVIRYGIHQFIEGALMCYEFDGAQMKEALSFIKRHEEEPLIRGIKWFLGVGVGENGAMEIVAHVPWNCTKYELDIVIGAFSQIPLATLEM